MKALFVLAVSAVLLLPFSALAHKGTKGIVKERMENFKASQMALNQILAASKQPQNGHFLSSFTRILTGAKNITGAP